MRPQCCPVDTTMILNMIVIILINDHNHWPCCNTGHFTPSFNHPPQNHQVVGPVEPGKCRTNTRLACNNQPRQKCGKTVSSDDYYQLYVGLVENLTFSVPERVSQGADWEVQRSKRGRVQDGMPARLLVQDVQLNCLSCFPGAWLSCNLYGKVECQTVFWWKICN